jgi:hypothetical protein
MKKLSLFILGAVCSLQLVAQEFDSAVDYNDYIIEQQNHVGAAVLTFNEVMAGADATKENIQPYHDVLILACHEALGKISSMSDYEGNFELRDAAIDLFTFYLHTFEDDYAEMINLVYSDDSDEATMDSINALLEKISAEEGEIDDRFAAAQFSFSEIHGFDLLENELQEEIDGEY